MHYYVTIDLGGSYLKGALLDENGSIVQRDKVATPAQEGPDRVLEAIATLVRKLTTGHQLAGVGVCAPGPLDARTGVVVTMPNLPGWDDFPFTKELSALLNRPVALENDANAAAIGEWKYGAGRGVDDLVMLTVGTGIGGGFVCDGKLLRGTAGLAGEPGHMTVLPDGPVIGSGIRGGLEGMASVTAAQVEVRRLLDKGVDSSYYSSRLAPGVLPDGSLILEGAREGDQVSRMALERMTTYLGIGIASLVNLLNPRRVIIGGGFSAGFDILEPMLKRELFSRAFTRQASMVELLPAELGNDAGLLGMLWLLRTHDDTPDSP